MQLEAKSRLAAERSPKQELTAAPYSRLLNVFDDEAKSDPEGLKSMAKNWVKNKFLDIDADIDRAFGGPKPNPQGLKKLKARLTALNEV